ncbi:ABC transporter ATP-binding protein [Corynebacterium lizhenjunii]|uniref:ABC transporter ATP-binding protein n=1 Tax=Corynebacterium lizhenjunii TaxID=2709394 RepID=UPI0013E9AC44|nr:ATP-binding cassette domain-containing protein [Corynebacterium lizhenjunii]
MSNLVFEGLEKSFGPQKVLDQLSFAVNAGEIFGFVGSNGAGKSTTMRIAIGVLAADSGRVLFGGRPVDDDVRRRIGYMPEERGLYGKEKIAEQLVFLAKLHGLHGPAARAQTEQLLERLGLGERMNDKLDSLSLGNQQKVQLAASLVHSPELLILDEPFSGLDPLAVEVMSEILKEKAQLGVLIIFSSHQLDLVQRMCDRVGILSGGTLAAEGPVADLRNQGPLVYRVLTTSRGWYPEGVRVLEESDTHVTVELPSPEAEQPTLHAAVNAGDVHGFYRIIPDLSDLFRKYVS